MSDNTKMKTKSKVRFTAAHFSRLERFLAAQSKTSPSPYSCDKGEDREEILIGILNNHLPAIARAYRGGLVMDHWDTTSGQTDVVVYSVFSPMLRQNRKPVFLAEGVFAAIEVKSVLDTETLRAALEWSARIKTLDKFPRSPMSQIVGRGDTVDRICTGVFAYTSRLKNPRTVMKAAMEFNRKGCPNDRMLDFISVNEQFCVWRMRTEDLAAFFSTTGETLQERRKRSCYVASTSSLGPAVMNILEYVSYMGPTPCDLSAYLWPKQTGKRSVGL